VKQVRRLLKGFTAVVLALSLLSGTAFANHFVYIGADSRFQRSAWDKQENWVFYWWALSSTSMWWWADADLLTNTRTAVTNWRNAINMPFIEVGSAASADVTVVEDNSIGAFGMLDITAISSDSTRNVNWSYKGEAVIRNAGTAPVGGWQATIAHELGHFFGLHERYQDDGGSGSFCNAESTIMNSGSCANRPTTPSALDVSRVNGIYRTGDLLSMSSTTYWFWPNQLYVSWKDGSWGEYEHRLFFYRWNGSAWVQLGEVGHTGEIGMRNLSFADRTMARLFNRNSYGQPAGYYIVCGWTRYMQGTVGNWACSNYNWVS
jgi:hypothetical protein